MGKCAEVEEMKKAKRIYLFENGKATYGKLIAIHPQHTPTWNGILNHLTQVLMPEFGAIQKLKTLDGKSVLTFKDLVNNQKYVACGKEKFVKKSGMYVLKNEEKVLRKGVEHYMKQMDVNFKTLIQSRKNNRIIIFVFKNGSDSAPLKLVLRFEDLTKYDQLLNHIANMLDMPGGVYQLHTIFGEKVCGPFELQHGGSYVAVTFGEKFQKAQYVDRYDALYSDKIVENLVNCQTPLYKYQIAAVSSPTNIRSKADFCIHKSLKRGKRHPHEKRPSVRPMSNTYKKKSSGGAAGEGCGCWDTCVRRKPCRSRSRRRSACRESCKRLRRGSDTEGSDDQNHLETKQIEEPPPESIAIIEEPSDALEVEKRESDAVTLLALQIDPTPPLEIAGLFPAEGNVVVDSFEDKQSVIEETQDLSPANDVKESTVEEQQEDGKDESVFCNGLCFPKTDIGTTAPAKANTKKKKKRHTQKGHLESEPFSPSYLIPQKTVETTSHKSKKSSTFSNRWKPVIRHHNCMIESSRNGARKRFKSHSSSKSSERSRKRTEPPQDQKAVPKGKKPKRSRTAPGKTCFDAHHRPSTQAICIPCKAQQQDLLFSGLEISGNFGMRLSLSQIASAERANPPRSIEMEVCSNTPEPVLLGDLTASLERVCACILPTGDNAEPYRASPGNQYQSISPNRSPNLNQSPGSDYVRMSFSTRKSQSSQKPPSTDINSYLTERMPNFIIDSETEDESQPCKDENPTKRKSRVSIKEDAVIFPIDRSQNNSLDDYIAHTSSLNVYRPLPVLSTTTKDREMFAVENELLGLVSKLQAVLFSLRMMKKEHDI